MKTTLAKTTFGLLAVSLTLGCGPGVHHDPLLVGAGGSGQSQPPQLQAVVPLDPRPYDARPGHTFHPCGTLGEGQSLSSAYSFDGTLFALGYSSGVVRIYRTSDLGLVATFAKASTSIVSLQFSPDGTLIASASFDDPAIEVWRVSGGTTVSRMSSVGRTKHLELSANGQTLGITRMDYLADLTDTTSTVSIQSVGDGTESCLVHDARLLNLSADGNTAWVVTNEIVTALNVQTCSVSGDTPPVTVGGGTPLAMSPDNQILFKYYDAATGQTPTAQDLPLVIAAVQASSGQTVWTAPTTVSWPTAEIALSPRGDFVVIAKVDQWKRGAVSLLKATDGTMAAQLELGALQLYTAVSPDGTTVVTTDSANEAVFWRASDGANVGQLPKSALAVPVSRVAFSADGTQLLAASAGQVRFWNIQTRTVNRVVPFPFFDSGPTEIALSPGDRWLAGWNDTLLVVRALASDDDRAAGWSSLPRPGAVFSADGQYLYAFSHSNVSPALRLGPNITNEDGTNSVSSGFLASASPLAVSPQGLVAGLVGIGFGGISVTLAKFDGTPVRTIDLAPGNYTTDWIAFSPDGQYLAAQFWFLSPEDKNLVRVWRVSDGTVVNSFAVPNVIGYLAFSPDGTMISTSQDVWNWRDGTQVESFLNTLEFNPVIAPDGRTIATTFGTSTVTLWCRP